MAEYFPGQKWISTAEPELGMGRVTEVSERRVSFTFDLIAETRTYSRMKAPMTRVRFKAGDEIRGADNLTICVTLIEEKDALLTYHGTVSGSQPAVMASLHETALDPNVRFSKPEDRLFTHQLDPNPAFNLRYRTRRALANASQATSRGLYGPRISLIPHQLYIGNEVARRYAPRVLLADEVGLGKTIEAGLIIHQQLITSRAQRVLVIVPPALTFQWFVEMIRRFNLHFTLLDEARCQQISADNTSAERLLDADKGTGFNPFDGQQLMLCTLDLFLDNPQRLAQALATDWDLVVVDEAHHLQWSQDQVSPPYAVVEQLSRAARGLLLLTATPEQLGRLGHFARLRLLDPSRYHDYQAFITEEAQFSSIAAQVADLTQGTADEQAAARRALRALLDGNSRAGIDTARDDVDAASDEALIAAILDRHGTGRVLFRNVRASVKGFPRRVVIPYPLPAGTLSDDTLGFFPELQPSDQAQLQPGQTRRLATRPDWLKQDPRVAWLTQLLADHPATKFLLICAHQQTALDLDEHLQRRQAIRTAVFHEGMDLIARDRAANYFAATDRGAQLLICSEIGSEGRNFQFASHLVLFDLPLGPDLLEQRIGRLDRIGQANDVSIHIPYLVGSLTARLYHWYADGLDAFRAPNAAAQGVFDEVWPDFTDTDLPDVIARSKALTHERQQALRQGRDQLLELNSHRADVSAAIVSDIIKHQGGNTLAQYMDSSFALFGLESEPLADQIWLVKPGATMARHYAVSAETQDHYHYPELPEDGLRITYNREIALTREDVQFLTWEHPLVLQAMDIVASDTNGNSTLVVVQHPSLPAGTLLLETLFIADCVAPAHLMADRYLPPSIIRLVIEPQLTDISSNLPWQDFEAQRMDINISTLHELLASQHEGIQAMLNAAHGLAGDRLVVLREQARLRAESLMDQELARLRALQQVNDTVRDEEIDYLRETRRQLVDVINGAALRLDALRVIVAA